VAKGQKRMKSLAALLGITGLAGFGFGLAGLWPLPLAFASLMMALVLVLGIGRDAYILVFLNLLGLTHTWLAMIAGLGLSGYWPQALAQWVPPLSMPIGASVFAALILAISYVPIIRVITGIAEQFFAGTDQTSLTVPFFGDIHASQARMGKVLLGALIAINLFQVALTVRLSFFSRDLFNALADKNAEAFWFQLLWIFVPLAAIWVSVAIFEIMLQYALRIRWREALNRHYVARWLKGGTHYHLQLVRAGADNPDQRIADDLRGFVDQTYQLSIGILSQAATLVSFIVILWGLSQDFTLPGTQIQVPGLLVWFAIVYALVGTWLTHLIGRPLIRLNFEQEKVEADYRFSLARLREYSEQIALMAGETAEKARLNRGFSAVIGNFLAIADRQKKLTAFTASFFQASVVVPYIVAAPFYFLGKITLGQLQQTAGAFSRVDGALTYFIAAYATLANYKAVIDRLTSFETALQQASRTELGKGVKRSFFHKEGDSIQIDTLSLALPDGRVLAKIDHLHLRRGESVLLTGPSGCGKSTLFRALAGIWPHASGHIILPEGARLLVLPQRPYIPMGTLRAALAYPSIENQYDDDTLRAVLPEVHLGPLMNRLDEETLWSQSLSLGEQQRLSLARALLAKPDWLFLDEATAALDEPTEATLYAFLKQVLPDTTIISIGHRSTLHAFHQRHLSMEGQGRGIVER
jgi:vitamin B12/bleomycin/antimicrobial peptide transport system ATP-binding/permease protein